MPYPLATGVLLSIVLLGMVNNSQTSYMPVASHCTIHHPGVVGTNFICSNRTLSYLIEL